MQLCYHASYEFLKDPKEVMHLFQVAPYNIITYMIQEKYPCNSTILHGPNTSNKSIPRVVLRFLLKKKLTQKFFYSFFFKLTIIFFHKFGHLYSFFFT